MAGRGGRHRLESAKLHSGLLRSLEGHGFGLVAVDPTLATGDDQTGGGWKLQRARPRLDGGRVPFSQKTKEQVRRRAWFACCLCKRISMSLEVHHIIPEEDDGPDTEDNAAPLCASCHRSFGGNRDLQARMREMRDHWYEECAKLFGEDSTTGDVFHWIHEQFSTEELERLTIHNPSYVSGRDAADGLKGTRFSFDEKEYVHPLVVKELLGWLSDSRATIVGVDLEAANRSNRFYGDFAVADGAEGVNVKWEGDNESFGYRHVATTPSGVEIVECHDWGGGSGVFGTVALFSLEQDQALGSDKDVLEVHDRSVLKTRGQFALGDGYVGNVCYGNGVLEVGPDEGRFRRGEAAEWKLPVL
ncbi:MAG: HNH endonuclease signature motif containing protein [Gammaproteobacteria bacterium]|nr:HNH endonuclease signature motif containing protein [Gammaproteobacteria bacterium]